MSRPTKSIRLAVFERAGGYCECGVCRKTITFETGHLDHAFGRAKAAESVSNCWALAIACDELKTSNKPSRVYWLRLFRDHCRRHRYAAEFERAQSAIAWLKAKGLAA